MSDSVRPHRWQPTRLLCPWDSPGKNTGVGCHFLLQCMKMKSESEALRRARLLATPRTAAYQASPSMGYSSGKKLNYLFSLIWKCFTWRDSNNLFAFKNFLFSLYFDVSIFKFGRVFIAVCYHI